MVPQGQQDDKLSLLSARERECLRLVHQGMSSKEIGQALSVSPHTVDHHLRHSIRKLSTSDRRMAARRLAASEADDPLVKDWLCQTLALVSAAGLVMDGLEQASPTHVPLKPDRTSDRRLPAQVAVERSERDTRGHPAAAPTPFDGASVGDAEGRRIGFELEGSSGGRSSGHPNGEQPGDQPFLSPGRREYQLSALEKLALIAGGTALLAVVLQLILPLLLHVLHSLSSARAL